MYSTQEKELILQFRSLYDQREANKYHHAQQMRQLRKMAETVANFVPQEHRELFLYFVSGQNIESGDPVKSAQYLGSLLAQHPGASIEVSDAKEKFGQLKFHYALSGP